MNDSICMNDWVFGILAHGEEFSIDELHKALGAKTTKEKKRVSRNLSYLVSKGTLERLKRGEFKNLNHTSDYSKRINAVQIDHCEDGGKLMKRLLEFKKTQGLLGYEFERWPLWDYEDCTSLFYRVSQNREKTGYLLLISEDDPQLKRVVRYVSNKSIGSNLSIFFKGTRDLKLLFPGVTWF